MEVQTTLIKRTWDNTQHKCKDVKFNTKGFCTYGEKDIDAWVRCHVKKFTGFIGCPYLWKTDNPYDDPFKLFKNL